MANIKNLQMWDDICPDARISIQKSLFGLRTTIYYRPTNSVIDAYTAELSPADGERLKHILELPVEELAKAAHEFHPKQVVNGNYLAEICASRDEMFLAIRLYQFTRMSYEPVSDTYIFEGNDARIVKQIF
ncbi:MAG: hypothetical protein IJ605_03420 [Prevotella sp.]|nr:hypothetical protein [Prevotella sp.]